MKRLMEYPIKDGSSVIVQEDEEARGGVVRRGAPSDVAEKMPQNLRPRWSKSDPLRLSSSRNSAT